MKTLLHGIIFAYQQSPKLRELTFHRNTASVPFAGRYRVIDFILSGLVDAGVDDVGLIVENRYQSLLDHVGSGKDWDLSRKYGGLRILPPFGNAEELSSPKYQGRMAALSGVYSYLQNIRQDYVVLAPGDLIASLPLARVLEDHIESGADITAVCTRRARGQARGSTYFTLGAGGLVSDVSVRPASAMGCESLEIYILSKQLLISLTDHCTARGVVSLAEGVLAKMSGTLKIAPWFFTGYAARMQTVAGYFDRSMELLDPAVRAELFDPAHPVRTKDRSDPSTYYGPESSCLNSLVADGCVIEGEVERSILFRGVRVETGAKLSDCIIMQSGVIRKGAHLSYVIADKNVRVNPGRMLMGYRTHPLALEKNASI